MKKYKICLIFILNLLTMIAPSAQIMPLFAPKYDTKFYHDFSLFKQKLLKGDFSEETRILSERLLREDKGNYSAWYAKKMNILQSGASMSMENERGFADSCLTGKAKSFQVWEQKRFLAEMHQDYRSELASINRVLREIDHKNYHAWSYRVWLVTQGKFYEQEIAYAHDMIQQDCFNNSAWTYRFFLVEKIVAQMKTMEEKKEMLSGEIDDTLSIIKQYKGNRASWNYLRGLFPSIKLKNFNSKNFQHTRLILEYQEYPQILHFCTSLLEGLQQPEDDVSNLMAHREILCTLVHIYSHAGDPKAIETSQKLVQIDKQRATYWHWVASNL